MCHGVVNFEPTINKVLQHWLCTHKDNYTHTNIIDEGIHLMCEVCSIICHIKQSRLFNRTLAIKKKYFTDTYDVYAYWCLHMYEHYIPLISLSQSYDIILHQSLREHVKYVQRNYCRHSQATKKNKGYFLVFSHCLSFTTPNYVSGKL